MYSAQLLDHFEHPRNAGDLEQPDATGEMENPACGDVLRLSVKVACGRVVEAGFKAKGCVPSMACGSAIAELILGKTVEEARALRREDLTRALGELPEASSHATQLALETLAATLKQIKP